MKIPTRRGLRVFHNSNTAQKVEIVVPAGAELDVDVMIAEQLAASSTHFEVDAGDFEKAKTDAAAEAAEDAKEKAEEAHRAYHRLPNEDEQKVAPDEKPKATKARKATKSSS